MAEIDPKLQSSWNFYRTTAMTAEQQEAAAMLTPVPAVLGLTEWRLTNGEVYAKGANAIDVQVGINRRKAAKETQ